MHAHRHRRQSAQPAQTTAPPPSPELEAPGAEAATSTEVTSPEVTTETPTLDEAHAHLEGELARPLARAGAPAPRQAGLQQRTVMGVVIAGTDVSPTALDMCERIVTALLGANPVAQERLATAKARVVIVPSDKKQTDVPEFASLAGKTTFDGRPWDEVRGSGGTQISGAWVIAVPEENLVSAEGAHDAYGADYSVALHEIAHTVHLKGLTSAQTAQLEALYAQQGGESGGPFTEAYGGANVMEYFAQCTNAFFQMNSIGGNGPAWLQANDPDMYDFLVGLYGTPEAAVGRAEGVGLTPATPAAPATPEATG